MSPPLPRIRGHHWSFSRQRDASKPYRRGKVTGRSTGQAFDTIEWHGWRLNWWPCPGISDRHGHGR